VAYLGQAWRLIAALGDWKGWKVVSAVLAASIAVYVVAFAPSRVAWDWDVVAYSMATLRDGTVDPATLHARTWKLVEAHVPAPVLEDFTVGAFRERLHADPAALQSQLPLFEIKLGYILILKALAPFGDPIAAMILVATLSSLGVLGLLFAMAWDARGIAALAWVPVAGIFNFSGLSANIATPDTLTAFVYAAGAAAFLSNRFPLAIIAFIVAAVIRPDCFVLNVVLGVLLWATAYSVRLAALLLVGSLSAYAIAATLSSHVGWWGQFYLNWVDMPADLSGFKPVFSLHVYLGALATSLKAVLHFPWVYGALGTIILAVVLLARKRPGPAHLLLPALVAGVAARFMLYPAVELRLYWPVAFSLGLVMLAAMPKASDRTDEIA
jgi:hypothetical protein